VQVPSGLATNCDTATEISGTAGPTGTVAFGSPGLTIQVGGGYTESGTGSVYPGGQANIVVTDTSNPGLFVVIPITLATA
jgi:hypothetical protein